MSLVLAGDTRSLGDGSPHLVVLRLGRALAFLNHAFCDFPHCEDDLPGLTYTTPPSHLNTDSMAVFRLRLGVGGRTEDKAAVTTLQRAESPGRKCHFVVKIRVKQALDYKVAFSSRTFSSLKRGHCGFIFGSSSYTKAKAKYSHAVRVEMAWRGRVSESWKVVLAMRKIAKRMVKKCQCATKTQYYKVWRTITKTTRVARQNKAHAKCKMMACVLKGTPLTSKKCKGSLPPFKKKKLHSATAKVKCTGRPPRPKIMDGAPPPRPKIMDGAPPPRPKRRL
jgi:hypothetical protein